jgi:2,5-diketo-D-gluconate reductase B
MEEFTMIYRSIRDVSIPAIGLGTWDLRGPQCSETVSFALQNGYSHVDTAAYYENESEVGDGIRASNMNRSDLFLTTKVWWDQLAADAFRTSAETSLRKLQTDYVDLLLVHWPNPDIPLAETIGALVEAKTRGLARSIGVSNFPSALLRQAQDLAGGQLVTNQVEYHPFLSQRTLLQATQDLGMALTAYCPIVKGRVDQEGVFRDLAEKYGKSPVQIALRWHVQQPNVIAIPKSSNPDRLKANIEIFDFELDSDEMAQIFALGSPDGRLINAVWGPVWDPE